MNEIRVGDEVIVARWWIGGLDLGRGTVKRCTNEFVYLDERLFWKARHDRADVIPYSADSWSALESLRVEVEEERERHNQAYMDLRVRLAELLSPVPEAST